MFTFKVDNLKNMKIRLKEFTDFLRDGGADDDAIFASKLVSCELITNIIRHSGDEAEFSGALTANKIIITVCSESMKGLEIKPTVPDVFAESGRGLYIVRSLCCGEIERGENGEVKVYIKRH